MLAARVFEAEDNFEIENSLTSCPMSRRVATTSLPPQTRPLQTMIYTRPEPFRRSPRTEPLDAVAIRDKAGPVSAASFAPTAATRERSATSESSSSEALRARAVEYADPNGTSKVTYRRVGRFGFMIHNRYLPEWLHRLVNALVIGAVWCAGAIALWSATPPVSIWFTVSGWGVYGTPLVIVAALFVRRSLVRGVAGGEGYDELS